MKVEFNFHRKKLKAHPEEISEYLRSFFDLFPFPISLESVTIMGKWFVILLNFPTLNSHNFGIEAYWDAIGGLIVMRYDVIYRHFEVHGEDQSLIFKKDWRRSKR